MSAPVPDPIVRLQMHLNLAIQYALLLGAVLGLTQFLLAPSADRMAALKSGFQSGLIAGILVSVILGIRQWRAAVAARNRRLAADPNASATVNPGVRVEQTVRVPLSRTAILDRGESLAKTLDRGRFKALDEAAGKIILSTSARGWGWGERVVLAVGVDQGGQTPVTITSKPAVWGPSIDFGRNARNVERIAAGLSNAAADGPAGDGEMPGL